VVPTWLVAVVAAVCALTAAALPRQAIADEIIVVERGGTSFDGQSLGIEIDGRRVVVHALAGYRIEGYGSSNDEEVGISLVGRGAIDMRILPGRGPDEPTVIERGYAAWEPVRGATISARSFDVDDATLVATLEAIET
jgi:hypothetical protein